MVLLTRGGAVAARRAHNPKVVGSNPTPATKKSKKREHRLIFCAFFVYQAFDFQLITCIILYLVMSSC